MTDQHKPPRERVLEAAKGLITGRRNDEYGDPSESFSVIADLWTAYCRAKGSFFMSPHDVAAFMIMVKLARIAYNPKSWDSWIDVIGYAALGSETVTNRDD